MLQRSSRAFPMVRPVAGHHPALVCMPGCHGKHSPQPGQLTWYPVIQATRGWLSSPVEGARPSGDHLRPSHERTEQARYRRAIDAGCRPTPQPGEHPVRSPPVRRAETFCSPRARPQWTLRAPERSAHSGTRAECAGRSGGLLRYGAQPRGMQKVRALAGAFQPFVTTLGLSRLQRADLIADSESFGEKLY